MKYISASEYFKMRFGCKIYKLALNAGMTCPNRDGTLGTGGCIFCSNGSGDFSEKLTDNISVSIDKAQKLVKNKTNTSKYIAYLQSNTNTYAPVDKLRQIYYSAINDDRIIALSIATRPDCINDEIILLIKEINNIKPVFVELGLQTIFEKTAQYINRGYSLSAYDIAVEKLKAANINVIVHQIIGLPFETKEMSLETTKYIIKSGADGIKLHLLHVLKGTKLADDYLNGKFSTLSFNEYADILVSCLKEIPHNMVVHRITGDAPKKLLISPLWSADKKRVLNDLNKIILNS